MLKLGENRMRVIAPEVGDGFGCKLNVYREEALLAHLAELKVEASGTIVRQGFFIKFVALLFEPAEVALRAPVTHSQRG